MAPGRGGSLMISQSAILLSITVALCGSRSTVAAEEELPRQKFRHSPSNQHPSEWIAGPNGGHYQFHIGEQSWLAAREFCLAENADLVSIKSAEQLDWLLQHYAPTHPSFEERLVQIGLVSTEGSPAFSWIDGSALDQSITPWDTVPEAVAPGTRCVQLKVNEKKITVVDCDAAGSPAAIHRFVCARSTTVHNEQQRSNNYIWRKLENLINYFGFAGGDEKGRVKKADEEDDYWQAIESLTEAEKRSLVESAKKVTAAEETTPAAAAQVEGSGAEEEAKIISEANSASREEKVVDELKKDAGVDAAEKKTQELDDEVLLPVLKEAAREEKSRQGEVASLPEGKKDRKEEEDALNKPLALRELLDVEEGSGAALTEAHGIESADADLLASPTPSSEAAIESMIARLEKVLGSLQKKAEETTISTGLEPAAGSNATLPEAPAAGLIPIGPIIIEKAKPVVSGDEKVVDSAAEIKSEDEEKEKAKLDAEEKKLDEEVVQLSAEVREMLSELARGIASNELQLLTGEDEEPLLTPTGNATSTN